MSRQTTFGGLRGSGHAVLHEEVVIDNIARYRIYGPVVVAFSGAWADRIQEDIQASGRVESPWTVDVNVYGLWAEGVEFSRACITDVDWVGDEETARLTIEALAPMPVMLEEKIGV